MRARPPPADARSHDGRDDGTTELARIDVATNGIRNAHEAGIAIANEHATLDRPLRVCVEWLVGGELVSCLLHMTTLESIAKR
jgi:hypothetical protein